MAQVPTGETCTASNECDLPFAVGFLKMETPEIAA
jgi:hypothetical protein